MIVLQRAMGKGQCMESSERSTNDKRVLELETEIRVLKQKLMEQSKLEEQLFQAQKMEALGSLAAGIAHDFNNILQSVLGYTQLVKLSKPAKAPADFQMLDEIEKIIAKGSELTEQFLTFGRKVKLKFAPVDLNTTLSEIQKLLRRTIPRMIEIDVTFAKDLKLISADANLCEQVLMNLCINAQHAMQDNGKMVLKTENVILKKQKNNHLGTHLTIPSGEYVALTVSDNGSGIPPDAIRHIYEPFFTTKERGKGTGLGLSMVYSIVNNHGGYIDCTSKIGQGTTFRLYFPVLNRTARISDGKPHGDAKINVKGQESILLVDDEPDFLKVGKRMLQKFGYTVLTAETGERAIKLFKQGPVDLVLLDISMPGMGGIKCLKELMAIDNTAKILIVSGYAVNGRVQEALKLGGAAFLAKPYRINKLLRAVRKLLDTQPYKGVLKDEKNSPIHLGTQQF